MSMIQVDEESYFDLLNEVRYLRHKCNDLQTAGTAMVETRRNESITYNVEAFHRKYGHPVSYVPHVPEDSLVKTRLRLMGEEFFETLNACIPSKHWKELVLPKFFETVEVADIKVDLVELADGLCDLDYVNEGFRLVCGIPRVKVLEEVQRSNTQKIPNGQDKPIKPSDWTPPDIERVLREAGWNG